MNFKPGDKVRYLNDIGGGTIIRLTEKDTAILLNDFGFEVPVRFKDLVKVEHQDFGKMQDEDTGKGAEYFSNRYKKPGLEKKVNSAPVVTKPTEPEPEPEPEEDPALDLTALFYPDEEVGDDLNEEIQVYYAFVPNTTDFASADLDCYLINDCIYTLMFNYVVYIEDSTFSRGAGVLEANTKVLLGTYKRDSLNDLNDVVFQFIFYAKGKYTLRKPLQSDLEINPVKFYKETSFRENDFFDQNALIYPVIKTNQLQEAMQEITPAKIKKAIEEKENQAYELSKPKSEKRELDSELMEVDLHANELLYTSKGMTNSEIVDHQMNVFRARLDEAMKNRVRKVVFIHGVGNGKLKMEIRRALDQLKINYQDASYREYGYGATMALLNQNRTSL